MKRREKPKLTDILKPLYRAFLGCLPDEWAIQVLYYRNFKRFADLRNPRTFSEKTNWRKLHQRDPRFTLFSDKAAVKAEIARLIGRQHVIPTLWTGERPEDVPFEDIAPPYVIKVNHGNSSNIFIHRREDVDKEKIRAELRRTLGHSHAYNARQWGYYDIPRKILIEPMLDIFGKGAPEDYKFYVYHGRAHFVQVNADRWGRDLVAYFDRDWNRFPTERTDREIDSPLPKPPFLAELITIAEKIGAGFDFVRVDLYYAAGNVFFGETTFYSAAGYPFILIGDLDYRFGEPWIIPTENNK